MSAVGFVVTSRCSLKHSLKIGALALLPFCLVFKQRDLAGQLRIGVMRFIGLGFGVADAALNDRLVDGVVFRRFLGSQSQPDKQPFEGSEHNYDPFICVPEISTSTDSTDRAIISTALSNRSSRVSTELKLAGRRMDKEMQPRMDSDSHG